MISAFPLQRADDLQGHRSALRSCPSGAAVQFGRCNLDQAAVYSRFSSANIGNRNSSSALLGRLGAGDALGFGHLFSAPPRRSDLTLAFDSSAFSFMIVAWLLRLHLRISIA
jgi:hypothetical protein